MARISFTKVGQDAEKKLVEIRAAVTASKDAELKAKLDATDALLPVIGQDATDAARSAVLAAWTAANPSVVTVTTDEKAAIQGAITVISTAAPIAVSHSQLLRSDLDVVKGLSITPLRLLHGLLSDFLALPADEQAAKLASWREYALVSRDYSAENVLTVANLLPKDESPAEQDEKPAKAAAKKK